VAGLLAGPLPGRGEAVIFIVLPAYNEEKTLPPLLAEIASTLGETGHAYRVVVVDDGSTDGTAAVVRAATSSMPISLVSHPANRGLSEALKTGLLEAQKGVSPRDVIVTMDSDNTHIPGLILRMVRMIREGYDVVIASRYRRESRVIGVPLSRRILSRGASLLFRILFPTRGVRDFTSGYRAYRASLIQEMFAAYGDDFVNRPGFSCMVDILLKIRRRPMVAGEVPLILRYDRRASDSKMRVGKTVLETLGLIGTRLFERR
jgi:dolichol-phosphate mannosyltransferase